MEVALWRRRLTKKASAPSIAQMSALEDIHNTYYRTLLPKYPSTQVLWYTSTLVLKYPSTQVPKYPSTLVLKYPSTLVP